MCTSTGHWLLFLRASQIDEQKPDVVLYPFGSRNPPGFAAWSEANAGVTQSENWQEFVTTRASDVGKLTALFNEMDTDGSGKAFGLVARKQGFLAPHKAMCGASTKV